MPDQFNDRYIFLKVPARVGGHAEVRKAIDMETDGSAVAVKFIRGVPDERITRQLFERETAALRSVHHPNIVNLLESGWDPSRESYYLILEWLDETLADVLAKQGPYSWDKLANNIAQPLADALAHAHLCEITHRDIKPLNVLFNEAGIPKLTDFGIARMQAKVTPPGLTLANFRSDPYTPPGADSDTLPYARDVFSFAVLLIQALSPETLNHHDDILPALAKIDVPLDIRLLLEESVRPDASLRPANGPIFAQRLRNIGKSRAARVGAETGIIWLKLTRNAVKSLLPDRAVDDSQGAANLIQRDLSRGASAEFKLDKRTRQYDRNTLYVTGYDYQLTLKRHQTEPALVVVGVRECEDEWRDKAQRVACPLGSGFAFQCTKPLDITKAKNGLEAILTAVEDHRQAREAALLAVHGRKQQDELFEKWLQTLEAREDLERGGRRPLAYRGREISTNGRQIRFSLVDTPTTDLVGQDWEVTLPETRRTVARGEIVNQESDSLTMMLYRPGRSVPTRGELVPYLDATKVALLRQHEAIDKIKTETAVRSDLRTLLLDPATAAVPEKVPVDRWLLQDLAPSKREAVAYALGAEDFLLIQGPPGTGKTSVITEIVAQLVERKPETRVLIVSQTHVAVDNVLQRLDEAHIPGLVRLGRPEDPRVAPEVRHLLLDRAMEHWALKIQKQAETYLAEESERVGVSQAHLRAALALQQLANVSSEVEVFQHRLDSLANDDRSSDLATGLGLTDDVETTHDALERLLRRRDALIQESRAELAGALTIRDDITADEAEYAVEALLANAPSARRLLEILKLQADWMLRLTSDQDLASVFLKTANVVAGTCVGFLGHRAVRDVSFDVCILDEASKATATEALVPLARAQRWILVGDTRQLPPMDEDLLHSPAKLEEYGLEEEFVATTLFDRLISETAHPVQLELVEQYRMIRPIGNLISTCFYNEKLRSPVEEGIPGYSALWGAVSWIDTTNLGSNRYQQDAPGGGVANRTEANLVTERLKAIDAAVARGVIVPPDKHRLYVLAIAPYRLQIEEIQRKLAGMTLKNLDVEVQSVDAVQGKQSDLTIFSVTRSNSQGRFGFLGYKYWRRINVALSRARYGLVIVGDADFCRSSPGALREVINYMEGHPEDCRIGEA